MPFMDFFGSTERLCWVSTLRWLGSLLSWSLCLGLLLLRLRSSSNVSRSRSSSLFSLARSRFEWCCRVTMDFRTVGGGVEVFRVFIRDEETAQWIKSHTQNGGAHNYGASALIRAERNGRQGRARWRRTTTTTTTFVLCMWYAASGDGERVRVDVFFLLWRMCACVCGFVDCVDGEIMCRWLEYFDAVRNIENYQKLEICLFFAKKHRIHQIKIDTHSHF